jgi:hypothetical protein
MPRELMAMAHYRIHVMELWPDGPRKEVGLAAIQSALQSLARTTPQGPTFACVTCGIPPKTVIVIPCASQVTRRSDIAA